MKQVDGMTFVYREIRPGETFIGNVSGSLFTNHSYPVPESAPKYTGWVLTGGRVDPKYYLTPVVFS